MAATEWQGCCGHDDKRNGFALPFGTRHGNAFLLLADLFSKDAELQKSETDMETPQECVWL